MNRFTKSLALMLAAAALSACSDTPLSPLFGDLEVITVTTGLLDSNGYRVAIGAERVSAVEVTGSITFAKLDPGEYSVELTGVPLNCVVSGNNPRAVTINRGTTTTTTFDIECEAARPVSGRIAFWSIDGGAGIHLMNRDGSDVVRLSAGEEPAFSPDGARILFVKDGDVHVMSPTGSAVRNMTRHPALDFRPRWSPDGTSIAFTSDRAGSGYDIFVMDADGSNLRNVTNNPGRDNAASWSPDGSKIAFTSNRTGEFEIFVMNADGSDPINLTNDPSRSDYAPAWSPDGRMIAFASDESGRGEIFVMNADGSARLNLTNDAAHDTWPSWSPDGSQITFTSDRTGTNQVFLMNADGSNPVNLSNSPQSRHFAGFPQAWSP